MRISRKAEYALRALTAMARKPLSATSQIEELATAEHIPVKFLEQILLTLKRAGLLKSRRGVGGGYQLDKPAARISLADILTAIDGPFQPMSCTPPEPGRKPKAVCECRIPGGCGPGHLFTDLQNQVHAFLSTATLADAIARESTATMQFDI
jgi:Rrf2 family transcriptional regulator, iron-sulfur cluster assembly transcription factor